MSAGIERPHAGAAGTGPDDDGVVRLALEGDLEVGSVQDLRNDLDAVLRDHRVSTVVLDLRLVRFVDSSGLGALIDARRHADATGTQLVLRNPGTQLRRLMSLTGTDKAFTWA